ncbi:hypothetical protein [Halopelagius longus]|uniref:Uncharacterized protein n=1 Tax=Halopelagius longus TaxID=1236180 RepID=A0A1H0XVM1_9EURY|nr:hypothetical protein [Halopelagius longus]RDI72119.1 hypothetical protein DWB78_10560 [Halopelagius longus]SDQ06942.1 hypothetical protein SAMN05216278_0220 [Halopelagius longus]
MPSTRRAFVGGFACLGSTVLGGCLGGAPTASNRGDDGTNRDEPTTDGEPTPDPTPGEADPVSVSKTVEDVAYVPENETVRIVAAYRHANHEAVVNGSEPPEREPVYEEIPWERWAEAECATVASKAVAERLADELDGNGGASVGVTAGDDGLFVSVEYVVTYDRDGEKVSETNAAFDRLVAATPREVTATVTLDGRTATRTVPTRVRYSERHYA